LDDGEKIIITHKFYFKANRSINPFIGFLIKKIDGGRKFIFLLPFALDTTALQLQRTLGFFENGYN
jgi:hypothetical protein